MCQFVDAILRNANNYHLHIRKILIRMASNLQECDTVIVDVPLEAQLPLWVWDPMSQLHLKSRRITDTIRKVSTKELLGNKKQLQIRHNGAEYTLRITSNNKLILTK